MIDYFFRNIPVHVACQFIEFLLSNHDILFMVDMRPFRFYVIAITVIVFIYLTSYLSIFLSAFLSIYPSIYILFIIHTNYNSSKYTKRRQNIRKKERKKTQTRTYPRSHTHIHTHYIYQPSEVYSICIHHLRQSETFHTHHRCLIKNVPESSHLIRTSLIASSEVSN